MPQTDCDRSPTPAEVRALTDDQLRVEIAWALGWSRELDRVEAGVEDLPDWPRSLDACAESLWPEIEKRGLRGRYISALVKILGPAAAALTWPLINPRTEEKRAARLHAEAALLALAGVATAS